MQKPILPFAFIFVLAASMATPIVRGEWIQKTEADDFAYGTGEDVRSTTTMQYLKVGVYPAKGVFRVGEDIYLELYVSTGVDEAYLMLRGPGGTISDKIDPEILKGEVYITYKVGVAEERDIGRWTVTFQACYYVIEYYDHNAYMIPYCASDTATFEVVPGPAPDLNLTVTPNKSTLPVGEVLRVEVSLTNQGDADAYDVQLSYASEAFELTTGHASRGCKSLAPGQSCPVGAYNLKALGPTGMANITFSASYTDEKGKGYQRMAEVTINITVGFSFQMSNLYETEVFADYYSKLLESPYPFHDVVEVTVLGGGEVDSVYLRISGLTEDKIQLENAGGRRFRKDIVSESRFSPEEIRDLTWLVVREMAKYKGLELPPPNWDWKQPSIPTISLEEIVAVFKDTTEVRKKVGRTLPTITEILEANLPEWTKSGAFILAVSKDTKSPVDLLVTNPDGLKVGAAYEGNKFSALIKEVAGSLYSGRDSSPQLIHIPLSSGEYRIRAHGKSASVWDLLMISMTETRGSFQIRKAIHVDEGESLEFKTSISEVGTVEEFVELGPFSWLQMEQIWPAVVVPVLIIVVVAVLLTRRRGRAPPAKIVRPPPTMPEEVPDG